MSRETFNHHLDDLLRGMVGAGSSILAFAVSQLETIEAWLRIASLIVGIAVGIASLISIIRRNINLQSK